MFERVQRCEVDPTQGAATLRWIEQIIGLALMFVFLLDVFLTVLYARMGSGIISTRLARGIWLLFRKVSQRFPAKRGFIFSFCGPLILVILVLVWGLLLTCGTGMVIHPMLGTSVQVSVGPTPTDFASAMYAGGSSVAIVSASDFVPKTTTFRVFYLLNSIIGISGFSLALTYLMQIYTALHQRNALGLKIHLMTGQTKDAANLVAAVGSGGVFESGDLSELAAELVRTKESHHFYPVLFYFRFTDSFYSVSNFALVVLDAVTLLKACLDEQQYGALKKSAAVTQVWDSAILLVTSLEETFIPGGLPKPEPPDAAARKRWRARYFAALERLREAKINTVTDEEKGAESYIALRTCWDAYVKKLALWKLFSLYEIDPVGSDHEPENQAG